MTTVLPGATAREATHEQGGADVRRPRRFGWSWLGLIPFLLYVALALLVPIGFIVVSAFRRTTQGASHRDPVTQQFVHSSTTTWTGANLGASLHGVFLRSLLTSVELSAVVAVAGAVCGLLLAHAVATSRSVALRQLVTSASAVLANFGGIPLAFLFIATLDANAGIVTKFAQSRLGISLPDDLHLRLSSINGLALVYLYFLIPLMVLVMAPALEGLRPQWAEAATGLGASRWQYWRHVAGPVLFPNVLGATLLLFCSSFSAYATAYAINSSFPLVTIRISSVLSGNVLPGQENLGAALALDMIVIVLPFTVAYQVLQRRTTRWLA